MWAVTLTFNQYVIQTSVNRTLENIRIFFYYFAFFFILYLSSGNAIQYNELQCRQTNVKFIISNVYKCFNGIIFHTIKP